MENTSNIQQGERADVWPALPYEAWRNTCQTLHLWTQIVGKVRMELSLSLYFTCVCSPPPLLPLSYKLVFGKASFTLLSLN